MARADIPTAVAQLCEALPEVEPATSHGSPIWKGRGKHFATFSMNHHGNGRVAILLKLPEGEQQRLVEMDPEVYFVPAYYGPSGWVGVELNGGADWARVCSLTLAAWQSAVPKSLAATVDTAPKIPEPRKMKPEEIDPFQGKRGAKLLEGLRERALLFPETTEDRQFGAPCFRTGKKNFCTLHVHRGRFGLQTWVGTERQAMLRFDERHRIPSYIGRNGWIELDLEQGENWKEIEALLDESFRHFATKRALKALDAE